MSEGLGLLKKGTRTCAHCGATFEARRATARFCSKDCLKASARYGRSYGQYAPRAFGITKT